MGTNGCFYAKQTGVLMDRIDGVLETQPTSSVEKYDLIPYAEELTSSATITPSAGKKIQVVWCQVIAKTDNTTANLVTIGFAGGSRLYRVYALGRTAVFTGVADQVLNIDLTNSQPVTVNIHYRELP